MTELTKLETVAAMAMQGLLHTDGYTGKNWDTQCAEDSVKVAQALLAECAKAEPKPEVNQTFGGWRLCKTCGKPTMGAADTCYSCSQVAEHHSSDANKMVPESCNWSEDEDGYWNSQCGVYWQFNEGGPKESRVKFCSGCGKPVAAHDYKLEEDESEPDPDGWIPHVPGDECPCLDVPRIDIKLSDDHILRDCDPGDSSLDWGVINFAKVLEIVAWRPAK